MNETIKIEVYFPKRLADHAKSRLKAGDYRNESEYVCSLISEDLERSIEPQASSFNKLLAQSELSGICNDSRAGLIAVGRRVTKEISSKPA